MHRLSSIIVFFLSLSLMAQPTKRSDASEIYHSIQKLNFLGSVLYIAAHPDDENTALIAYFANKVHAQTSYFSMTRGDGGQNLIGPELRELLGVIRTQELLQARNIDGGMQFFSRANDFGFSKNPEETFRFWEKEEILRDLVYHIRKLQPDIIINRFDHRTPGTTHGHHTASAQLSVKAFELAGDENAFSEQLKEVKPWQPKKMFFNDSWFFYDNPDAFAQADQSNKFGLDIGAYYPQLGWSNGEIAALSRSAHSSQGFGSSGTRGSTIEYLEPIYGKMPKKEVFEEIDTSWKRVEGGAEIGKLLKSVEEEYDFRNPIKSIPKLIKAYELISTLNDEHWKSIKLREIEDILLACLGLYMEVQTEAPTAIAGEKIECSLEVVNRSDYPLSLKSITIHQEKHILNRPLTNNQVWKKRMILHIPENVQPTNAYWLDKEPTLGMYHIEDKTLIGLPETPPAFTATFELDIEGTTIHIKKPIHYSYTDPARGEKKEPFVVVPKAAVEIQDKVVVFNENQPKTIQVKVQSFTEEEVGTLRLYAPEGWKVAPQEHEVSLKHKNVSQYFEFKVFPPKHTSEAYFYPSIEIENESFDKQFYEINYDHIPKQRILLPSKSKFVHIDIDKEGDKIGYVQGAGDEVGEYLKQIGYQVEELKIEDIQLERIQEYDAIVLGVRAFNVLEELKFKNKVLFKYVYNGGNVIVQYNVSRGQLVTDEVAPYFLQLSTDRVTDENSKVSFLDKNHAVLHFPNKITPKDFEGWVQERGLYFPDKWEDAFEPILSMNDEGEDPLYGSLLVAKYGKGYYVYTGLSFFRELPAGVPGAYRLFANLLSIGKETANE